MRAYIRRDIKRGRDYGLIVVSEADFFTEPLFFSLQRFTDGKYLSENAIWRSTKEEIRAGEYHWVNGILSIVVGPDILCELDTDTTYRMSINSSASFPLVLERDLVHSLKRRAARESALAAETRETSASEADALPAPRRHTLPRWALLSLGGGVLLVAGAAVFWHVTHMQSMPLLSQSYTVSANVQADLHPAVFVDNAGKPANEDLRPMDQRLLSSAYLASTRLQADAPDAFTSPFAVTVRRHLSGGDASASESVRLAKTVRVADASIEDTDSAFLLLKDAADKGNTEAMFLLAQFYDPLNTLPHGSTACDPCLAREWYRRAEAGGLLHAYLASQDLRIYLEGLAEKGDDAAIHALRIW